MNFWFITKQQFLSFSKIIVFFLYLTHSGYNRLNLTISIGQGIEHVARQLTTRKFRNLILNPSRCKHRAIRRAPRFASSSLEYVV
jgi:Mn-dependent DtxR family transcriptional regulator